MQKKLCIFLFLIFSLLFCVNVSAAPQLPDIVINGDKLYDVSGITINSGRVYILPEKAAQLFGVTLSTDDYNSIYTLSNPVRSFTYNVQTGSVSISDRNSFAYDITASAYPSLKIGVRAYMPLRMVCTSLGIDIDYIASQHKIVINKSPYFVGFYNSNRIAVASKGKKFGIVNDKGDILLPFEYDSISNYDNPMFFKIVRNHRCGIADSNGSPVTDVIYNDIEYVSPGEIYLYKDNEKGMCSIDGRIIVPVEYDDIAYSGNLIAMVKQGGKWYLLNCSTGEMSDTQYDEVYEITQGIQTDNHMIKGYYARKNGKWGCIDSFGNTVIKFRYEALDKFDMLGRARVIYNGKMGIIDCGGSVIVPTAYDHIQPFGTLRLTVAQLGNKYGAINLDGTVAIPFEYEYIYPFNNAPTTVAYKDGVFSVLSTHGKTVGGKTFAYIEEFKNGMALAYSGGYGYIDHNAQEIIDCVHTDVKQGTALSVFLKKDDKWALYSPTGVNMTGYIYNDAGNFENGLSAVSKDTDGEVKYGYVNDSGDVIIPFIYNTAQKFKYGKAIVSNDSGYGIIDIEGNVVIPFDYSGFNPSYDYNVIAAASSNSKWGLISFMNTPLTDFVYDYIFEFENGYAAVLKDHKYGVINAKGEIVVEIAYDTAGEAVNILNN